ncbi:MAG: hypothetical protein Ta2E_00020 [Mycoplasmoidaceae bacterium]|nr:MAG: hypothetical protein Ta2E_00020 [Mycoplasmoidaceae bacterium]
MHIFDIKDHFSVEDVNDSFHLSLVFFDFWNCPWSNWYLFCLYCCNFISFLNCNHWTNLDCCYINNCWGSLNFSFKQCSSSICLLCSFISTIFWFMIIFCSVFDSLSCSNFNDSYSCSNNWDSFLIISSRVLSFEVFYFSFLLQTCAVVFVSTSQVVEILITDVMFDY